MQQTSTRQIVRMATILSLAACAVCMVFLSAFRAGFLGFDDPYLITGNTTVLHPSLGGVKAVFSSYDPELYIPLTFVSYQFDSMFFGMSPLAFHLHNLVLHLLSGLFVFLLVKRLTKHLVAASFVTFLFLVHPLQTEAVMWLAARKDLQASCFALASSLCYLLWAEERKRAWYVTSLGLFACALLSKVSVAVLPLLFILFDEYRGRGWKRGMHENAPFWLLSGIFACVAVAGKTVGLSHLTPASTVLIGAQSFVSTMLRFLFPVGLNPLLVADGWETFSGGDVVVSLVCIGLLGVAWRQVRRKNFVGFLLVAFFILLSPSIFTFWKDGVVYLGSDRYAYLAILPLAGIVAWGCEKLFHRAPRSLVIPFVGLFAGMCCVLTFLEAQHWQSDRSLFSRAVFMEPQSHIAHMNLGNAYRAQGDAVDAIREYLQALEIKPDYAPAYRNIGALFVDAGKPQSALVYYRHSLGVSDAPEGHYGLGVAYLQLPDLVRSERELKTALSESPALMDAYIALGAVYYARKDAVKERETYEAALKIDPMYVPAQENLRIVESEGAPKAGH